MTSFALKSDGNIDTTRLEKDLRSALDFDIKYKQADNMKKRACKIATDYDEFKAFVACAHLKTVNRAEISSLGTAKKGWQKSTISDKSCSTLILSDELKATGRPESFPPQDIVAKKPKSPMELERDLRKLSSALEKNRYLAKVGMKRVIKLLQADGDAELLESIIVILLTVKKSKCASSDKENCSEATEATVIIEGDSEANDITAGVANTVAPTDIDSNDTVYNWLEAFTDLNRFDLMIRFFSKDLIIDIVKSLHTSLKEGAAAVIAKYQNTV